MVLTGTGNPEWTGCAGLFGSSGGGFIPLQIGAPRLIPVCGLDPPVYLVSQIALGMALLTDSF